LGSEFEEPVKLEWRRLASLPLEFEEQDSAATDENAVRESLLPSGLTFDVDDAVVLAVLTEAAFEDFFERGHAAFTMLMMPHRVNYSLR
jgi:hypothetical protein